jgi:hypothetical protein
MILGLLTILIMLGVAYAFVHEGLLTAATTCVNIVAAGLVAFNLFEPLAKELEPMLVGTFLQHCEDSICLMLLFCLTLGLLRFAVNNLVSIDPLYPPLVHQIGAGFFGLIAGYLASGFLLCVIQTLPMHEKFLRFEPEITRDSAANRMRRILPPDRVWLALMQFGSRYALGRGEDYAFDKDGTFELRYARHRRTGDGRPEMPYTGEPYETPPPPLEAPP